MTNSRRKGADGEREFARLLTAHGYPARRGQQHAGGTDSPDVVCERLAALGIHIEVKVYKTCQMSAPAMLAAWDAQARADAGERLPVIAHKWLRSGWWMRVLPRAGRPYWQTFEDWLADLESK